ncbi:MAG: hypothetical protein J0L55_02575 [Caulobacterales bacterium]|nr:hypothetical protein [Caulobacterales bacterium]MCA0372753.1 esterase family protein [Pseudomonadota bacterium]
MKINNLFKAIIAAFFSLIVTNCANAQGLIVEIKDFKSQYVINRNVSIWLPDNYDKIKKPLKVLYMQDGENLFEPSHSLSHKDWGAGKSAQKLINEGKIEPFIIVGIWSTKLRGREYLPNKIFLNLSPDLQVKIQKGWEGVPLSDEYLKFITRELKPFIDKNYNVSKRAQDTAIMGSSMGGLISFYAQMEYPKIFGQSASLSMHWLLGSPNNANENPDLFVKTIDNAFIDYLVSKNYKPSKYRIYIDHGDETLDALYRPYSKGFEDWYFSKYQKNDNYFQSHIFNGTNHSECAWADRLEIPFLFLLGNKK